EPSLVQHAEVPYERLEACAEAGRGDDGVRSEARAVGEEHLRPVEALDRGHDLDPAAADRLDDADVEDRRRAGRDERGAHALFGPRYAVRGQVGNGDATLRLRERIDPVRR